MTWSAHMPGTLPTTAIDTEAQVSPGLFAPNRLLRRVWEITLDLVFPPRCAGCGRVDDIWCSTCQARLDETPYPSQVRPLAPLSGIISTAEHQGVIREAVQGLKYGNARILAQPLGERMVKQLQNQMWTIDMIIPVPLHTSRLAERGYNQAQLLAEYVAKAMSIPCTAAAVSRQRNTQSQVTLSAAERQTNLQDAFRADAQLLANQHILLIDDVYTTGATLSACATAVLQAGAAAVYGLTVTVARL
jgi:ComF family protein